MDASQPLRDFKPAQKFFIGLDSDGCVFDSMEIKQKECFTPMFIKHFHLQAASKYARQTWEFVNLYSKSRGCNRFHALSLALNLLRERKEVIARQVAIVETKAVDEWTARENRPSNDTLAAEVKSGNAALAPVLAWSRAVNAAVEDIVHGVPPFPLVRECLEKMTGQADAMVISQTPGDALRREWAEHKIDSYVKLIAGQEMGTKTEHLQFAAKGKYPEQNILMIGDAPGDRKAAQSNGVLFYPIVPHHEEQSWQRLLEEGLPRFFAGKFKGEYEDHLAAEFEESLPASPPW
ncbi:MAG TPA: HAD hydrolase-like protein [Candidatus Saccharimonadales bacterium]|nr:HAD hydrolase-like protein [Candidatus Saccharimonadales bacterium]